MKPRSTSLDDLNQTIQLKELSPDLWPALEGFFLAERCSGCWCMNHRLKSGDCLEGEPAKDALSALVRTGGVFGILAFDGKRPIGWCAFDRMSDLPGLDCGYAVPEASKNDVWSIHCTSVLSSYPKDAVVEQMVGAAVAAMEHLDAKIIEAYPPPTLPSDNSFSGTVAIFERHGFQLQETVNKFYTRMVRPGRPQAKT